MPWTSRGTRFQPILPTVRDGRTGESPATDRLWRSGELVSGLHPLGGVLDHKNEAGSGRLRTVRARMKIWKEALGPHLFVLLCWGVTRVLPRTLWYPSSLWMSRALARIFRGRPTSSREAIHSTHVARALHRFLDVLTRWGPFPIPVVVEGEDILRSYAEMPGGFVCCSAHLPFIKLFPPIVRKVLGPGREHKAIAREPVRKSQVDIWNDVPWDAIEADNAVLLHVRSLLRKNGCLMVIVDKEQGEFVSANIFRFVGKMHSRILMWFPQLQSDGSILLRVVLPPGPRCRTEEEIRANLDFVAQNSRRILRGDAIATAKRMAPILAQPFESPRSRELHRIRLYTNAQLESRMQRLRILLEQHGGTLAQRTDIEERLALMEAELESRASV